MRKTKWIFFFYLAIVGLFIAGVGFSLSFTPPRDPYTLYTEHPGTIRSLDPAEAADEPAAIIMGEFYECLYNYKYAVTPYELFPELAADMPVYSDGGRVMTIRLRKGIRFYDPEKQVFPNGVGPAITAKDVIYSFKRVCDANLSGVNYSTVFEGRIVGIEDWWNYTKTLPDSKLDWDRPVKGFQILDDHTIRLVMPHPDPQMIYNLAASWTSIVSRDAVNYWKQDFRNHPVGTGAYYLKENLREQRIVMEANPIYRGRPDVDGDADIPESEKMPHIKRMEYDYFTETLPPWILFTQGLFDAAVIPKESFNQAIQLQSGQLSEDLRKKGVVLTKSPLAVTEYIGFNMEDPIVGKNLPLRQAMSMAFDRKSYIRNFWNGRGLPAIGPIPPGFPTYDSKRGEPLHPIQPRRRQDN